MTSTFWIKASGSRLKTGQIPIKTGDSSNKEPLSDGAYAKALKDVLIGLGLPSDKKRLGRRCVSHRMMKLNEFHREDLRQLDNWNSNIYDESYSSRLPTKTIRGAAGFVEADGIYCNPRTHIILVRILCSVAWNPVMIVLPWKCRSRKEQSRGTNRTRSVLGVRESNKV